MSKAEVLVSQYRRLNDLVCPAVKGPRVTHPRTLNQGVASLELIYVWVPFGKFHRIRMTIARLHLLEPRTFAIGNPAKSQESCDERI